MFCFEQIFQLKIFVALKFKYFHAFSNSYLKNESYRLTIGCTYYNDMRGNTWWNKYSTKAKVMTFRQVQFWVEGFLSKIFSCKKSFLPNSILTKKRNGHLGDTKEKKLRVILINRWNLSKSINLKRNCISQWNKKTFLRKLQYLLQQSQKDSSAVNDV